MGKNLGNKIKIRSEKVISKKKIKKNKKEIMMDHLKTNKIIRKIKDNSHSMEEKDKFQKAPTTTTSIESNTTTATTTTTPSATTIILTIMREEITDLLISPKISRSNANSRKVVFLFPK